MLFSCHHRPESVISNLPSLLALPKEKRKHLFCQTAIIVMDKLNSTLTAVKNLRSNVRQCFEHLADGTDGEGGAHQILPGQSSAVVAIQRGEARVQALNLVGSNCAKVN